ncbi:MAG: SDR family oxidoreductase [Candidatus Competibacterales bacterium]
MDSADLLCHRDRLVVVTGAGRGIGRQLAATYGAHGARVAVLDIDGDNAQQSARAITAAGGQALAFAVDCAEAAQVEATMAEVSRAWGTVDTLINNAGISPKHAGRAAKAGEMALDEWHRVVDVNLNGAFYAIRAVVPPMMAGRFGRIVNMASVAGRSYCDFIGVHYATTKAALIGMTRHLAGELGPYNITVNALAPGRIDTPLMAGVDPELNQRIRQQTPLGRFGTPLDVAHAALFLTSKGADFITGQVCDVAGGWSMT